MRGQTSLEFILIVAIVITVAGIVFVNYSEEADRTLAEVTIRNQAELILSNSRFTDATCAEAKLVGVVLNNKGNYTLEIAPGRCKSIFTSSIQEQIQGRVAEALGCKYDDSGFCKGTAYGVGVPIFTLVKECPITSNKLGSNYNENITMVNGLDNLGRVSLAYDISSPPKSIEVKFERVAPDGSLTDDIRQITAACGDEVWCEYYLEPTMSFLPGEKLFIYFITAINKVRTNGDCDDPDFEMVVGYEGVSYDQLDLAIRLYTKP